MFGMLDLVEESEHVLEIGGDVLAAQQHGLEKLGGIGDMVALSICWRLFGWAHWGVQHFGLQLTLLAMPDLLQTHQTVLPAFLQNRSLVLPALLIHMQRLVGHRALLAQLVELAREPQQERRRRDDLAVRLFELFAHLAYRRIIHLRRTPITQPIPPPSTPLTPTSPAPHINHTSPGLCKPAAAGGWAGLGGICRNILVILWLLAVNNSKLDEMGRKW